MDELKPCPFCGSSGVWKDQIETNEYWYEGFTCEACGAMMVEITADQYNERAEEYRLTTELAAAKAEIERMRPAYEQCNGCEIVCAKKEMERHWDEMEGLKAENQKLRSALARMWFAYVNKDPDDPHDFEISAVAKAESLLGDWKTVMMMEFGEG